MVNGKPAWYDVETHGRLLNNIINQMNTKYNNSIKNDPEMALTYLDRLIKCEHAIKPYIELMTGMKKFIKRMEEKQKNEGIRILN